MRYCLFQKTDPSFYFEFSFAMPIRPEFEEYFSAWLNVKSSQGEMFQLHQEYVVNKLRDVCSAGEVEAESLGLAGFLGTVIISVTLLLIGLCLGLVQKLTAKKSPEANPGGDPSEKAEGRPVELACLDLIAARLTICDALFSPKTPEAKTLDGQKAGRSSPININNRSAKMALLSAKVAELKARLDAFKPKKTVKKKAASKAGGASEGGEANRHLNDTPMSFSSDAPSQPGFPFALVCHLTQ